MTDILSRVTPDIFDLIVQYLTPLAILEFLEQSIDDILSSSYTVHGDGRRCDSEDLVEFLCIPSQYIIREDFHLYSKIDSFDQDKLREAMIKLHQEIITFAQRPDDPPGRMFESRPCYCHHTRAC